MTYQNLLTWGKHHLLEAGVYDDSFRLLLELCQQKDIDLYVDKDQEADLGIVDLYQKGISRLSKDEPLAYILGYEWFFGRKFQVNSDVLIPRPETEELVGLVLSKLDEKEGPLTLFDIACGSGNLGLTLALEEDHCQVILSDISDKALAVAKRNAEDLSAKATFFLGDMARPFKDRGLKADVIVCNPPYILNQEEVQASVLNYEPHVALFGGDDGLKFYRSLLDDVKDILNPGGFVAFEMGYDQKEALTREIKKRFPKAIVSIFKDIHQKDRMCLVENLF